MRFLQLSKGPIMGCFQGLFGAALRPALQLGHNPFQITTSSFSVVSYTSVVLRVCWSHQKVWLYPLYSNLGPSWQWLPPSLTWLPPDAESVPSAPLLLASSHLSLLIICISTCPALQPPTSSEDSCFQLLSACPDAGFHWFLRFPAARRLARSSAICHFPFHFSNQPVGFAVHWVS